MRDFTKIFTKMNWGWITVLIVLVGSLIGIGMSYRGITAKQDLLQVTVQKQDGRLNGHEERLKKVEASLLNLTRIDENIATIRDKAANLDTRMANLEKLNMLVTKVDQDSLRIDKLEDLVQQSARDRASINTKLDTIQNTMQQLINMHLQK